MICETAWENVFRSFKPSFNKSSKSYVYFGDAGNDISKNGYSWVTLTKNAFWKFKQNNGDIFSNFHEKNNTWKFLKNQIE